MPNNYPPVIFDSVYACTPRVYTALFISNCWLGASVWHAWVFNTNTEYHQTCSRLGESINIKTNHAGTDLSTHRISPSTRVLRHHASIHPLLDVSRYVPPDASTGPWFGEQSIYWDRGQSMCVGIDRPDVAIQASFMLV